MALMVMMPACTVTTHKSGKYEILDIPFNSLQKRVKPGDKIQITSKQKVYRINVTGYESNNSILGIDEYDGNTVKILFDDIEELRIKKDIYKRTYTPTKLAVTPFALLYLLEESAREASSTEYKKSETLLTLEADREKYLYANQEKIIDDLGMPAKKYICSDKDADGPHHVWEYFDKIIKPYGVKYFYFSPKNKEVFAVSNYLKSVDHKRSRCCAPLKDMYAYPEIAREYICTARDKRRMIDFELEYVQHAKHALASGDLEASYRLIEDGLISDQKEVQSSALQFLHQHPEIMDGARQSFALNSLKNSAEKYGDAAKNIEHHRLSIYKKVATTSDYQLALDNYQNVFGDDDLQTPEN